MERILIVTDVWHPQISGVVRTIEHTCAALRKCGYEVMVVGPDQERPFTVPLPTYPAIRLEFFAYKRMRQTIGDFQPDHVHIATEGLLGWAARRVCLKKGYPFSTAWHTNFPAYIARRSTKLLAPAASHATYAFLRRFHAPAHAVMVPTISVMRQLQQKKFRQLALWSRGVDLQMFRPYGKDLAAYRHLPRPLLLYVGRLALEKNVEDFLKIEASGSKIVIGTGPLFAELRKKYPDAHFLGSMSGENLARHYAAADLFIFPSKTDTFGLVILEALACGLPVAAYPSPGPCDIFGAHPAQDFVRLDHDLERAVRGLLAYPVDPALPRAFAEGYSWEECTRQFVANL